MKKLIECVFVILMILGLTAGFAQAGVYSNSNYSTVVAGSSGSDGDSEWIYYPMEH